MIDTACYDIIAQDTEWDENHGRGSYCVHVTRIAAGRRSRPNLAVAIDKARQLLKEDRREQRYYDIVRHYPNEIAAIVRRAS